MTRRIVTLLLILALGFLVAPLTVEAQPPKHVPRIGVLITNSRAAESTSIAAFHRGLQALGYVEGQNIVTEYRYADGTLESLPPFAAELVRLNVDVRVTTGSPPTRAAQHATTPIPMVLTVVGDPIDAGCVARVAKPGGNLTGLTQIARQLSGQRLARLKEAFPEISRGAVFVDGALTAQPISASVHETPLASQALGSHFSRLRSGVPIRIETAHSARRRVSAPVR
jgi:putative tryptophan/tyrosine transport system substrate-binding protein